VSDRPLLETYCQAVALVEQASEQMAAGGAVTKDNKPSPWVSIFMAATKAANNLALRLRISPQARSPRQPKTLAAPRSYYDELELTPEEGCDDDGDTDGGRH
jgi:phage terminase small subunit